MTQTATARKLEHVHTCSDHGKVIPFRMKSNAVLKLDPTHTLTIRRKWAADATRRLRKIKKEIRESLVTNDALGLIPGRLAGLAALPNRAFAFETDAKKVEGFMNWLQGEVDREVLEVQFGPGRQVVGNSGWQNVYIDSAYKKGIGRADRELKKAGLKVSPPPGVMELPITAAFNQRIHADAVGLIYTRSFNELRGITDAMDQQISRVLAQGLAEGRGAAFIARQINNRVDKIGITRARTLARTETIRAHHVATINTYREAQLEGVRILAEWSTAGFNVCPDCAALEGRIFTLDEIEGTIPLHPNCRCVALPANVGERPSVKIDKSIIDERFRRADGTIRPPRKLFEKITGKPPPPRVGPKARGRKRKKKPETSAEIQARIDRLKNKKDELGKQTTTIESQIAKDDKARDTARRREDKAFARKRAVTPPPAPAAFATDADAQAWADRTYKNWSEGLDDIEFRALTSYQSTSFEKMNDLLRSGKKLTGSFPIIKENMDKAISRTATNRSIQVFRGFNHPTLVKNFDNLVGTAIKDKAYVSTSLSKDIATRFQKESKGILAEIRVPKGTKGAWIGGLGDPTESEFLLPRGSLFKIIETRVEKGVKIAVMDFIGVGIAA